MVRRIAILNFKGGVGKTTTAANLGHALSLAGRRVVLVDMDPQGHLGLCLGCYDQSDGLDRVLLDGADASAIIVDVRKRLGFIAAGGRLSEVEQGAGANHGEVLRDVFRGDSADLDFVFFDCPPADGTLARSALGAVDEILIPVTGEYLSLQGVSQMVKRIRQVDESSSRNVRLWLLMTRFHRNRRLAREVLRSVRRYFPENVLATPVREATLVAECSGQGRTVIEQRPGSGAARDYRSLADDLIEGRLM